MTTIIYKTVNGGVTNTAITPATISGIVPSTVSSIMAVDDSNTMAVISTNGNLFTSSDGGATWTSRGTDATELSVTSGYFPRPVGGQHTLYMGGSSKLAYSADFGLSIVNKVGNWVTAVGAISNVVAAIPLY